MKKNEMKQKQIKAKNEHWKKVRKHVKRHGTRKAKLQSLVHTLIKMYELDANKQDVYIEETDFENKKTVQNTTFKPTLLHKEYGLTSENTRHLIVQLGKEGENIPCLALTDNHDTFSAVHTIKPVTDPRMQADVVVIRQAIHEDKTISELRFTPADTQLADCLTKITKNGEDLMKVLRTGHCFIPGGTLLRDSTAIACKTWHDLLRAEEAAAQLSSGSSPSSSASPPAPTSS